MKNQKNKMEHPSEQPTSRMQAVGLLFLLGGAMLLMLGGLNWLTGPSVAEPTPTYDLTQFENDSPQGFQLVTNPGKSALIVDQLSTYYPNPGFVQTATQLLEAADYTVDYITSDEVTVDFYRTLPTRGDDLILLRVHGTAVTRDKEGTLTEVAFVSLATGEPVTDAYPREIRERWLGRFQPDNPDEPSTFTVMEGFFKHAMQGRFDDSVIVLMGCDGLRTSGTADYFIKQRNAQAVVGWDDVVSLDHMDEATIHLLQRYLSAEAPDSLAQAVASTQAALGPDPVYQAELQLFSK